MASQAIIGYWHHCGIGSAANSCVVFLWQLLYRNLKQVFTPAPAICRYLYSFSVSAFILKVLLQFSAVYPQLGQLAFGFRPVIIGYLHLIFLAFISLYLLALLAEKEIFSPLRKLSFAGLATFAAGVVFNEVLLAVQGFAAIGYVPLPEINKILFANTVVLFAGAMLLFTASVKKPLFSWPPLPGHAS
ncbi:MAG: hypothetical protein INR73_20220 [Williamsia sp.]|nr:hypothetical protein [Williamsia sp.]